MKDKNKDKRGYNQPRRLNFPGEISVYPWLSMLVDAYYLIDKGIAEALSLELKKGRKLACAKGCSSCCKTHQTIPVYPLELVGLSWYVTEKLQGPARERLKKQLRDYRELDACPFLIEGACSVHAMRPAACRQFNVFGSPCAEGEDPYYTRREDVMVPIRKYVDRAFFIELPFYGVNDEAERWKMIETGYVHNVVRLLQNCNWKSLAEKMEEFEGKTLT
ncbi:MAG TPA: YkgJ family cysteine cluster protein [Thermodesulfovibrionales bacterium]|nr:YkgJ family cysteine cluster protein [Thermodesulfovibrionales bacterium]